MKKITEDQKQSIVKALDQSNMEIIRAFHQIDINAIEIESGEWNLSESQRTRLVEIIDISKKINSDIKNSSFHDFTQSMNNATINIESNISFLTAHENIQNVLKLISTESKFNKIALDFNKFVVPSMPDGFVKRLKLLSQIVTNYKEYEIEYKNVLRLTEAWLIANGFLPPINFEIFFERWVNWQKDFEKTPEITDSDFIRYSKIRDNELKDLSKSLDINATETNQPEILKKDGTKFTLKQIAYLYYYNNDQITKDNCDSEVKKYGWETGHALRLKYNNINKNRLKTSKESKTVVGNRIKTLESIIEYLPEPNQVKVNDELRKLNTDLKEKEDKIDF